MDERHGDRSLADSRRNALDIARAHVGFETVTLVLDGTLEDPDEGGLIRAGEVQWMTAGGGIIHGEHAKALGKVRLLQLWLTLPKADR